MKLDIEKVIEARSSMSARVAAVLEQEFARFEREVGVAPSGVEVMVHRFHDFGDPYPRHVLAGVNVEVNLEVLLHTPA